MANDGKKRDQPAREGHDEVVRDDRASGPGAAGGALGGAASGDEPAPLAMNVEPRPAASRPADPAIWSVSRREARNTRMDA